MEEDRFKKIEGEEITSGIIKKKKEESRFDHLEVEGREEKKVKEEKKYFSCPKCKGNNQKGNLYCIYCGYVFPDVAEKTDSELNPYEIKCPSCGKIGNRNQKKCIWCGYSFVPDDEDILKEGPPVEIVVDGIKYSSKDPYLPEYIKKALIRIKKEKLSSEEIEKVVKEIRMKKAEINFKIESEMEKNKYKVLGFILIGAGGIFISIFRLFILNNILKGWIYIFPVIGTILIISGMITLSFGLNPSEIEDFKDSIRWRWRI